MTPPRLVWVRRGGWRENGGERKGVTRHSVFWLEWEPYLDRGVRF